MLVIFFVFVCEVRCIMLLYKIVYEINKFEENGYKNYNFLS